MEILISANEKILNMILNGGVNISEDMTEQEYLRWLQKITGEKKDNEHRIQEIPI